MARTIEAANLTKADIIFRVTGDNPAVSPEITSYLIQKHLTSGVDYTQAKTSSIGTAGNVIQVEALQRLFNQPKPLTQTEYLPFYFTNNPTLFTFQNVELPSEWVYPEWRLTIDEAKDLEMFEALYKGLNVTSRPLYFKELKEYLRKHPEIWKMNEHVQLKWRDDKQLVEEVNRATKLE